MTTIAKRANLLRDITPRTQQLPIKRNGCVCFIPNAIVVPGFLGPVPEPVPPGPLPPAPTPPPIPPIPNPPPVPVPPAPTPAPLPTPPPTPAPTPTPTPQPTPQPTPEPTPVPPSLTFDELMLRALNQVRQNPRSAVPIVQQYAAAKPGLYTNEQIQNAINFLNTTTPCSTILVLNAPLDSLAQQWVNVQGPTGQIGHGDFNTRVRSAGTYNQIGEVITYGYSLTDPWESVVAWIISIPHREVIFDCGFYQVGVGTGPHATYNTMVNVMLANNFIPF